MTQLPTPDQLRAISADSECTLRTVQSVFLGFPSKPVTLRRIARSIERLRLPVQLPAIHQQQVA